jgi:peptide/nickel transport system substrate-binding protein
MYAASQSVPGDHYTFVPNPNYYDKSKVHFSKVVEKVIASPSSMLQALQAGQLQVAQGDPTTAGAAASSGMKLVQTPFGCLYFVPDVTGTKSKPLADARVRKALNYALDRKTIAAAVAGRFGSGTSAIPTADGFDPRFVNYYPYDPAKAKSLLAAAGYSKGFTIEGGVAFDGAPSPISGVHLAQAVAKYLGEVGVTWHYQAVTPQEYVPAVIGDPPPLIFGGVGWGTPLFINYNNLFKKGGLFNHISGGWSDPTIDGLVNKALRASNPGPLWRATADRWVTQAYYLPVVNANFVFFASKRVQGLRGPGSANVAGPYLDNVTLG